MKRVLLAGLASAALAPATMAAEFSALQPPYIQAPPPLVPVFSWSGFYLGGNAGYSWSTEAVALGTTGSTAGQTNGSATPTRDTLIGGAMASAMAGSVPTSFRTDPHGFIGGGQLGYNFQSGWFIYGFETDFQGAGLKASKSLTGAGSATGEIPVPGSLLAVPINAASSAYAEQELNWFGTVRARIGFTPFDPHLLIYGTGGFAYGEAHSDANYSVAVCTTISMSQTCSNSGGGFRGPTVGSGAGSSILTGWTAGAGVEYAFAPGWSLKTEWLHYDLGSMTYSLTPSMLTFSGFYLPHNTHTSTATTTASADFAGDIVRVGLNYKFW